MAELTRGIAKNLENISKLKYIMSLDDNIKDVETISLIKRLEILKKDLFSLQKRSSRRGNR